MPRTSRLRLAAILLAAGLTLSCSSGKKLESFPRIEVIPAGGITFIPLKAGLTNSQTLRIRNSGEAPLDIASITLDYQAQSPDEQDQGLAFSLSTDLAERIPTSVQVQDGPDEPRELRFDVSYKHYDDNIQRRARIRIRTNDPKAPVFVIDLEVQEGKPALQVDPDQVVFDTVRKGKTDLRTVKLLNTGNIDLEVRELLLLGHQAFHLIRGDNRYGVNEVVAIDPPLSIPPGRLEELTIEFAPLGQEQAEGSLVIQSNDPTTPSGLLVQLLGNQNLPCLEVSPKAVDFKGQLVASTTEIPLTLANCGSTQLTIRGISWSDASSGDFGVDFGSTSIGAPPTEDDPLVIGINQSETVLVAFIPGEKNPQNPDGTFVEDEGTLVIANDSFEDPVDIEVRGFGVEQVCPVAKIDVVEGVNVIPQTNLHLKSDGSFSPSGDVDTYFWDVKQPPGSKSVFVPSPTWPNPTFQANVAGEYVFSLEIEDSAGTPSCEKAEFTVVVIPDEAIHVELLWDTPNDQDQSDEGPEAGADLDLHFVHPYAGGLDLDSDGIPDGWFDLVYDCFWFNSHPNWGSIDPNIDDDPGLDRDDTDGAGPENLNLNIPEDVVYRVGVHYFDDHGYGLSFPTVRVYIFTSLLLQVKGPELNELDMWEVARIDWTAQSPIPVQLPGGGPKVIPNYPTPIK